MRRDPLGTRRASQVTPAVLRAAVHGWAAAGSARRRRPPGSGACARRWAGRIARASWTAAAAGYARAVHGADPTPRAGGRGLPDPPGRATEADNARRRRAAAGNGEADVHRCEQILLLARLAADTGARRGELAALDIDDLDGDVLTISRGASNEMVGPTKSGRVRRLTLGATTARLWRSSVAAWRERADLDRHDDPGGSGARFGPWLFSRRLDHSTWLTTSCAGHWFAALAERAGHPDVTLHRLRHTVATVLVIRSVASSATREGVRRVS
ncbi:MAG: tyrosine-type recombinase/integrase [Pseudonocardia sp.]